MTLKSGPQYSNRTPWYYGVGLLIAMASPAHAIDCEKGYQRVQGNLLATPYCQDNYLAEVAREYGVKVSAERIRNNPNTKRDVCRIAGRDIRVQTACIDAISPGRNGRF